ncbi:MAG: ATPase, T2SS/T4P/T4SS family [Thermodesulfobacteriota bacterium]
MAVKKLGELLVESGLITEEQLKLALDEAKKQKNVRVGAVLIEKGYATDIDIAQTLAFQLKIPFVELSSTAVDPEAIKLVNENLAKKYLAIPLEINKKVLKVAMADPLNLDAIDDLRFATGMEIKPCAATHLDVNSAINRYYHINEPIEELMVDLHDDTLVEVIHESESTKDVAELVRKSTAPPIIKMVDSIIIHAVDNRASDIHIEPHDKTVKLRLRIDGLMKPTMQLPKWVLGPVVSRIKIMAKMDIAERRVSQDGRIKVRLGEKNLDIRVSTLPTQYGETVVMRLLDPKAELLKLEQIGSYKKDDKVAKDIIDIIERPQGVVLVTGPTGSGKTSSLYAMIKHIMKEQINIITIEDPVEYELKGVNQVAVNEKTGLSFAFTLRSVLRQDPDVILVGEMRDTETAIIAHQASLTGHLVFTTLHTNDAVSSITRLRNLGVPLYIIASSLNGIVAQRLVRVICPHCKQQYTPTREELEKARLTTTGKQRLYRGVGCDKCNDTGYAGRTGIFEVLKVDSRIRNLIVNDAPEHEIRQAALASGMVQIQQDGRRKVIEGITTLEELTRVIYMAEEDELREGVCPSCQKPIPSDIDVCPHCEKTVSKICRSCSRERKPDWVICPYCATWFEEGQEKSA